jgi:hypothetical protein
MRELLVNSACIRYEDLIKIMAEVDDFCPTYTMNNLTVDECFPEVEGMGCTWSDVVSIDTLLEILQGEVKRRNHEIENDLV